MKPRETNFYSEGAVLVESIEQEVLEQFSQLETGQTIRISLFSRPALDTNLRIPEQDFDHEISPFLVHTHFRTPRGIVNGPTYLPISFAAEAVVEPNQIDDTETNFIFYRFNADPNGTWAYDTLTVAQRHLKHFYFEYPKDS